MLRVFVPMILTWLLVVAGGCGRKDVKRNGELKMRGEKPIAASNRKPGTKLQQGIASWYGKPYHGRKTANGERYDMWAMTAAHKSLEFGTLVRVVNEKNGQSVVVRINDRGPFIRGRVIDLSRAAAGEIGLDIAGVAPVTLYLAEAGKARRSERNAPSVYDGDRKPRDRDPPIIEPGLRYEQEIPRSQGYWTIQVGSFSESRRAYVLADRLKNWSDDVSVDREDGMTKVRVGRFATKSSAGELAMELAENDFPIWIILIEK